MFILWLIDVIGIMKISQGVQYEKNVMLQLFELRYNMRSAIQICKTSAKGAQWHTGNNHAQ